MSEPFIGEIRMFGFNFPPRGWSQCDGQLIAINTNQALFSLLGTTFGGDGRTTFALPDLRSRSPKHLGTGPGLASNAWGQKGGNEQTSLLLNNLPPHSHTVLSKASPDVGNETSPVGNIPAVPNDGESNFVSPSAVPAPTEQNSSGATGNVGSGTSFSNLPPYLAINFSIALLGIFPSRN